MCDLRLYLQWKDLAWLRSITGMKLVLKGVQCGEDAVRVPYPPPSPPLPSRTLLPSVCHGVRAVDTFPGCESVCHRC